MNHDLFCSLLDLVTPFAFSSIALDGSHSRGLSMWIFRTISEDKVPSNFKELLSGVLFIF